jgi:hypothetical protein
MPFDLENYLATSRALDTSGVDWAAAAEHPVSDDEIRCLTYMMDIESHTIMYMRDLLNSRAVDDPGISAFLACWAYEESYHGRAFERFLGAVGVPVDPDRVTEIRRATGLRASFDLVATFFVSRLSRHFTAAYLTWGAINELSTHSGYRILSKRTRNPVLRELLVRIMRDESRHFAFYYSEAEKRLAEPGAQRLTRFLLTRFWAPVGSSVKPAADVDFVSRFLFGGDEGADAVRHVETTIRRLPGLDWFDLLERACLRANSPG